MVGVSVRTSEGIDSGAKSEVAILVLLPCGTPHYRLPSTSGMNVQLFTLRSSGTCDKRAGEKSHEGSTGRPRAERVCNTYSLVSYVQGMETPSTSCPAQNDVGFPYILTS